MIVAPWKGTFTLFLLNSLTFCTTCLSTDINMKFATLNNGRKIPLLGLGTWKSDPGQVKAAVKAAVQMGYRHIDCAFIYGNEREVGEALAECLSEGVCTREELFITSKLWNDAHAQEEVLPALQHTLELLQLDYLDLYLIHWPVAMKKGSGIGPDTEFFSLKERPISATWKGMEQCVAQNLTKSIGVSNFSVKKLKELVSECSIPPAVNQVERHIYLQQKELVDYCSSNNIHVTGYSPLGSTDRPASFKNPDEPIVLDDATVIGMAKKLGISPAQLVLQWAIRQGTSTIPKSVNPARLAENLAAADVSISDDDMAALVALDRKKRIIDGVFWTFQKGSPYTVANLWDEE